jgi:hypothetical protein
MTAAILKPRNDASRTLLHGSASTSVLRDERLHGDVPCGDGSKPKGIANSFLIIAALTLLSSGICQAQQPHSAIGDGLIERIEKRADKLEARLEASTHEQGRIADFFERLSNRDGKGLLDRFDGEGVLSRFLDRVGRWGLVLCGTAVLLVLPFGVAYLIREVRRKT